MRELARDLSGLSCPQCGETHEVHQLLGQVERWSDVVRHADGSEESDGSTLLAQCQSCRASFSLSHDQVASLIIQKQTAELFSSISQVLRGKAKLQ